MSIKKEQLYEGDQDVAGLAPLKIAQHAFASASCPPTDLQAQAAPASNFWTHDAYVHGGL